MLSQIANHDVPPPRTLAILGALLGLLLTNLSPGAVIYTQLSVRKDADGNVPIDGIKVGDWFLAKAAGALSSYEFDVDGDGSVDLGFYTTEDRTPSGTTYSGVYAAPYGNSQILGCPYPPGYANPDALGVGMSIGSLIGLDSPSLYTPVTGVEWGGVNFLTGRFNLLTSIVSVGPGQSAQSGTFYVNGEDLTGYLAFRILKEDGWHYGWLEAAGGARGLQLYGIAWETDPGKALIAGVIPESSTAVLFGTGLGGLLLRRRRLPR